LAKANTSLLFCIFVKVRMKIVCPHGQEFVIDEFSEGHVKIHELIGDGQKFFWRSWKDNLAFLIEFKYEALQFQGSIL